MENKFSPLSLLIQVGGPCMLIASGLTYLIMNRDSSTPEATQKPKTAQTEVVNCNGNNYVILDRSNVGSFNYAMVMNTKNDKTFSVSKSPCRNDADCKINMEIKSIKGNYDDLVFEKREYKNGHTIATFNLGKSYNWLSNSYVDNSESYFKNSKDGNLYRDARCPESPDASCEPQLEKEAEIKKIEDLVDCLTRVPNKLESLF